MSGISDLVEKNLRFVNRQAGSGTRVLLDFHLKNHGIDARSIQGYEHEEFTHMAVAVQVASGLADTGLGAHSAAKALGLDFIPIGEEQYDLIFLRSFFESEKGQWLLATIRSPEFKQAIEALGGYDASGSGEIVYRQD